MPYKYETHLHTAVSSACAKAVGEEYVDKYLEHGYDGIFVTDHFYLGNTAIPRELEWPRWVERYAEAYIRTKTYADRSGLKVFFAWETTYGTGEDFLIYGLSPEWLIRHPEIISVNQAAQYKLIHSEGGAVVQAHPFRERWYMADIRLHPRHCDAWETINGGNPPYQDKNAMKYAEIFGKKTVCGSDIHSLEAFDSGKVMPLFTEKPLNSARDYAGLLLNGSGWSFDIPADRAICEPRKPELDIYLYDENNCEISMDFNP